MKIDDQGMEYKILEAAEKLFLEQGFVKTTTQQIAKLAGCNQALVHYYYRTKEHLFEQICDRKVQLILSNLLASNSKAGTFEEKVVGIINTHFDFLKKNPSLPAFILSEGLHSDRGSYIINKFKHYPLPVLMELEADLNAEIVKGTVRPMTVTDLLLTIVSLNVAPFLLTPVFRELHKTSKKETQEMLEQRKQEIIDTVLARLRK